MNKHNNSHLISVQALRGLAALVIVIGHSIMEVQQVISGFPPLPFNFGFGVDIFFIVSGFVMALTHEKVLASNSPFTTFITKRAIRVIPLYWIYTSLMLLAIAAVPGELNNSQVSSKLIVCSYTFVPCVNHLGFFSPVLTLGWTLNYEMFFYLLFAISIINFLPGPFPYKLFALLALSYGLNLTIGGVWEFWGDPIIFEFFAGVLLAMLYKRIGLQPNAVLFAILTTIGVAFLVGLDDFELPRIISFGLPAALVSAAFIFLLPNNINGNLVKASAFVGDSSYSLYLSHPFSLAVTKLVWLRADPNLNHPEIYLPAAIFVSIFAGRISYLLLEIPITRGLSKATQA